jgi:putative acetyltransferase
MAVVIRSYQAADYQAVRTLIESVLTEFGFTFALGGLQQDLNEISARYGTQRAGFWIAEAAGTLVGTVAIRPKAERTCELKRLYLAPQWRGQGLGQTLYAHAESFARQAGYERIWLDSSRRFGSAHRLYERNGFVLLERLDNDWEDNVYEKRLM